MSFIDPIFSFSLGAVTASIAGILLSISYWNKRKREDELFYQYSNGGCHQNSSNSNKPSTISNDEAKYIEILNNIKTRLNEETIKRHNAEDKNKKFQIEIESLNQEHITLQDAHEKLLKQYNELSCKMKVLRQQHRQYHEFLEVDGVSFTSLNNSRCSCYAEPGHCNQQSEILYLDRIAELSDTLGAESEADDDLYDTDNDKRSSDDSDRIGYTNEEESYSPKDPDFELKENVLHEIITRDSSITELLVSLSQISEKDDLSDLVGLNLEDSKDEDLNDLVNNNSLYNEEAESLLFSTEEHKNDDVNDKPLADVKSTRAIWETRIKEKQESPINSNQVRHSRTQEKSNTLGSSSIDKTDCAIPTLNDIIQKLKIDASPTQNISA